MMALVVMLMALMVMMMGLMVICDGPDGDNDETYGDIL